MDRLFAANFFCLQGHYYLLILNYYSNVVAVENLQNPKSETAINKCKEVFSQFGISKELIMNNCPELSSHKFVHFQKLGTYYKKQFAPIITNQTA